MSSAEYIRDLIDAHPATDPADRLVEQLYDNRNEAFSSAPIDSMIPVPVAMCDEPLVGVNHAINQYAMQADYDFNPLLSISINAPERLRGTLGQKGSAIERAVSERLGRLSFPASFFVKYYPDEQAIIGNVRHEQVAAQLEMLHYLFPDKITPKLSIIPGDIDPILIPPGAFKQLHEIVMSGIPLAQSNIVHARIEQLRELGFVDANTTLSNADEVMRWYDLGVTHNPFARQGPYYAMSVEDYLKAKGFNPTLSFSEDLMLQARVRGLAEADVIQEQRLPPELAIISSPRRMLTAILQGASPLETWEVVRFGAHENLRDIRTLSNMQDISPEEAARHIEDLKQCHFTNTLRYLAHARLGRDSRWRSEYLDPSLPDEAEALAWAEKRIIEIQTELA